MLKEYKKICIDTSPLIYYFDRDSQYNNLMISAFNDIISNNIELVTSVINVGEFKILPARQNNNSLLNQFDDFIDKMDFRVNNIDMPVINEVINIRKEHGDFKMIDAIVLATAKLYGCDAILTNDRQLRQYKDVKVLLVSEL